MEKSKIFDKVTELLYDKLGVEENSITEKSKIKEDLGSDSLDDIGFIMQTEDEFNVEISDEEIDKLISDGFIVSDVVDLVDSKI